MYLPSDVHCGWVWYRVKSFAGDAVNAVIGTPVIRSTRTCFSAGSRLPAFEGCAVVEGSASKRAARNAVGVSDRVFIRSLRTWAADHGVRRFRQADRDRKGNPSTADRLERDAGTQLYFSAE